MNFKYRREFIEDSKLKNANGTIDERKKEKKTNARYCLYTQYRFDIVQTRYLYDLVEHVDRMNNFTHIRRIFFESV